MVKRRLKKNVSLNFSEEKEMMKHTTLNTLFQDYKFTDNHDELSPVERTHT